jgi:hypothetical protein
MLITGQVRSSVVSRKYPPGAAGVIALTLHDFGLRSHQTNFFGHHTNTHFFSLRVNQTQADHVVIILFSAVIGSA